VVEKVVEKVVVVVMVAFVKVNGLLLGKNYLHFLGDGLGRRKILEKLKLVYGKNYSRSCYKIPLWGVKIVPNNESLLNRMYFIMRCTLHRGYPIMRCKLHRGYPIMRVY